VGGDEKVFWQLKPEFTLQEAVELWGQGCALRGASLDSSAKLEQVRHNVVCELGESAWGFQEWSRNRNCCFRGGSRKSRAILLGEGPSVFQHLLQHADMTNCFLQYFGNCIFGRPTRRVWAACITKWCTDQPLLVAVLPISPPRTTTRAAQCPSAPPVTSD
jgi:hypothetical protein